MMYTESNRERFEAFKAVPSLAEARNKSLELLAEASEEVVLSQGQTLLRAGVIETHASCYRKALCDY